MWHTPIGLIDVAFDMRTVGELPEWRQREQVGGGGIHIVPVRCFLFAALICISLMVRDMEQSFHVPVGHL